MTLVIIIIIDLLTFILLIIKTLPILYYIYSKFGSSIVIVIFIVRAPGRTAFS